MYQCSKKLVTLNNTVVLTILTFQHIQYLHLMYAEVAWVIVSSRTQVQPQIIPDPDYLPDYLFVSYMTMTQLRSLNHQFYTIVFTTQFKSSDTFYFTYQQWKNVVLYLRKHSQNNCNFSKISLPHFYMKSQD